MLELWQKNFFQQINKQVHLNKLLDPLPCVPKNVLHGIQKMSLIKKKGKREETWNSVLGKEFGEIVLCCLNGQKQRT